MAKSDWLKHLSKTYKNMKASNPATKLGDAMKFASKTFKKIVPVKFSNKTKYVKKHGKKNRFSKKRFYKKRGGNTNEQEREV